MDEDEKATAEIETPSTEPASEQVDRRDFLSTTWKVLGAALVIEAGWTSYDILSPKASGAFGGEVDAGPVADFTEEGIVKYFLNGRFYVTQFQGGLRALYQKCPHLGCKVGACEEASAGISAGFRCPCHGSGYNVIGEYLTGPAPRGLDRFPISIRDGHVFVDTSSVVEGPARGVLTGPTDPPPASCGSTP
jgi:cytochrome b6-f complex iron-sulfur subunit